MKNMIMKFMEKAGKNSEFKLFLDHYLSLPKIKFAVIKISGKVLEDNMEIIAEDIATLNRLSIYPVLVLGGGSMIDKKLPDSKKADNIRITSKEDMAVIKELFNQTATDLKQKIIEKGGSAGMVKNVFKCEQEVPKYGYVGKIIDVNLSEIELMLDNNITPIICPIGDCNGTELNINADIAAKEIVKKIQPKKYILLTETAGVVDQNGNIVPYINVSSRTEMKVAKGGMALKLHETKEFVKLNPDCSVAITGPENILEELFTIKGSGTFLKYHLIKHSNMIDQKLDQKKATALIESVFGKKLKPGYFDDIKDVFYEKDYEGIAVLKKIGDTDYLDKFAVAKERQGTGLGQIIWDEIIKHYPKFAWRATSHNPANGFYFRKCSGMMKKNGWNVYWINLADPEILPTVELIAKKEISWEEEAITNEDEAHFDNGDNISPLPNGSSNDDGNSTGNNKSKDNGGSHGNGGSNDK